MESKKAILRKGIVLAIILLIIGFFGSSLNFNANQITALCAFSISILGTILFWHFRLSFAFLGTTILLFANVVRLEDFLRHSSMEIILFLIGVMVLVGFLKEIGFFTWLLERALIMKRLSAKRFVVALVITSALLACAIDEVSSILFMVMVILELSDYFEVDPVPFIITSVLATNIGSAGTVIGNPIGIMIAAKAHLSFEDFLRYAFPLMAISAAILIAIIFLVFKEHMKRLDEKIRLYGPNDILVQLLSVPTEKRLKIGFIASGATLFLIAMHRRLEVALGLETNTILLIAPLFASAIIMVWRWEKARSYIEHDVEWWTLLFFMFLFAQAGVLAQTGVTEILANRLLSLASHNKIYLVATILFGSGVISSVLDNVVVVAGSIPVITSLNAMLQTKSVLWWALLFGACFGGNMTVIGSTANIVAVGALEKHRKKSIGFLYWLKIGLPVSFFTLAFILIAFILLPYYK